MREGRSGKERNASGRNLKQKKKKAPLVVFAPETAGHQEEKWDRLLGKGWRPIPGSEGVFWMDLNLTAEEKQFRDELRSWLEANVPKDWSEWREKPIEESFPYLKAWQRKLYEGGWAAVSWPKEYGGRGASLMQQSIFWGEMARVEAPPMANSLGLGLIGPTIIPYGTGAQKKRYIPKILSP